MIIKVTGISAHPMVYQFSISQILDVTKNKFDIFSQGNFLSMLKGLPFEIITSIFFL